MAAAARQFEMEPRMNPRTVIEEKVDHLQQDVTGLKANVKRLDSNLCEHRLETEKSIGKLRDETKEAIATLRAEMKDSIVAVKDSIAILRNDMTASIGALRTEMNTSIGELRAEMKDAMSKLLAWTVSTVIAAIGAAIAATKFFAIP